MREISKGKDKKSKLQIKMQKPFSSFDPQIHF
jgi:hypothetical protein